MTTRISSMENDDAQVRRGVELTRQSSLNLTIPQSVAIIGCGGVGSWVAMFLALAGVPQLYLWDGDEVSETNLNRLPLGPTYLNQNKALSLRHMLNELVPRCDIIPMAQNWDSESQSHFPSPTWIVAGTDSHRSRRAVYEWSQHLPDERFPEVHRCKYIECSAEGEWGGITDSPAMFTTELEDHPGYASVPVHVGPCVAAASMIAYAILHNLQPPFNLRFGFESDRLTFQSL